MQNYKEINAQDYVSASRTTINDNIKTLMSNNSGTEFPTSNLFEGMKCYRTDLKKTYTLKDVENQTWEEDGLAEALADSVTIAITGGATGTPTIFDGSGNISIPVTSLDATKLTGTAPIDITGKAATAATANNVAWSGVTGKSNATQSAAGLMSAADKKKLDGIAAGANAYSLPTASTSVKGGVKVGSGLSMNGETLYNAYSLPTASASVKGGIKIGSGLSMSGETLNVTNLPVGIICAYSRANTPPDGYLFCDGSAISRTTYADLFRVIGTTYGAGNGSTTFNLPNKNFIGGLTGSLGGKVPVVLGNKFKATVLTYPQYKMDYYDATPLGKQATIFTYGNNGIPTLTFSAPVDYGSTGSYTVERIYDGNSPGAALYADISSATPTKDPNIRYIIKYK